MRETSSMRLRLLMGTEVIQAAKLTSRDPSLSHHSFYCIRKLFSDGWGFWWSFSLTQSVFAFEIEPTRRCGNLGVFKTEGQSKAREMLQPTLQNGTLSYCLFLLEMSDFKFPQGCDIKSYNQVNGQVMQILASRDHVQFHFVKQRRKRPGCWEGWKEPNHIHSLMVFPSLFLAIKDPNTLVLGRVVIEANISLNPLRTIFEKNPSFLPKNSLKLCYLASHLHFGWISE